MKKALPISLLINLLLAVALGVLIDRFGGPRYVYYRVMTAESGGSYQHRVELFEKLSAISKPGKIAFVGDSQVEQCEWRELFGDSLDIENRGIVGDGASGVLRRIDAVLAEKPAKIILWFGVNDLIFGNKIPDAVGEYGRVLDKILLQKSPSEVVMLSVLPTNSAVKNIPVSNADLKILNEKLAELARSRGIKFIDLDPQMSDEKGQLRAAFTLDGLHLNGAGYFELKKQLISEVAGTR